MRLARGRTGRWRRDHLSGCGHPGVGAQVMVSVLALGTAMVWGLTLGALVGRGRSSASPVSAVDSPEESRRSGQQRRRGNAGVGSRGRAAPDGLDGRHGHTRRWAERRTTARGRRSTVGPLLDRNLPAATVGMCNLDGPRRGDSSPSTGIGPGGGRARLPRFGPHRVGPYDVECVRAVLVEQGAEGQVSGLLRSTPSRPAPAVIDRDPAIAGRLNGAPGQMRGGPSVRVAEGKHEKSRREAVAANMRDFPSVDSTVGEFRGERAAEKGAATVPLPVGADQDQRVADVLLPQPTVVSGAQSGEVQSRNGVQIGHRGGAHPGAARGGVRQEQTSTRNSVAVGVPAGPADQCDADARSICGRFQGATDVRVEVAVSQRLGSPRPGLLDEQPGAGGGRRAGNGFGRSTGSGSAGAHKGEPNRRGPNRNARPAQVRRPNGRGHTPRRRAGVLS